MEFSFILSSLNKISLFAFIVTFCILVYEVFLLLKAKNKKSVPNIPAFNENKEIQRPNYTELHLDDEAKTIMKSNNSLIIILIIFLVVFGLVTIVGAKSLVNNTKSKPIPVEIISSKGIIIYDKNWRELNDELLKKLKENDKIIIGIDKTKDSDINMARIKINRSNWVSTDVTLNYNENNNIFYTNYQIASNESALKIDAQLHSKAKGWLGN